MTFSMLGYCPRADQVGIALTSVTIGAGGTCPFYSYGGDIVVVQAYGNQRPAVVGARAFDEGLAMPDVVSRMEASDENFSFRQIGLMRRSGEVFALTGRDARPWAGHITGDGFIMMGNVLAGREVIEAMAAAFTERSSETLAERMLGALEAGRDAGGQRTADGYHYDERSVLLRVIGDGPERREVTALDLRVDMHPSAINEMRRMFEIYKPVIARRSLRANNPGNDLATYAWEAENMKANPPPPALRS
ncbi:MAG: DUF1028 domain-containing protein [Pseudomonadota bacterium]